MKNLLLLTSLVLLSATSLKAQLKKTLHTTYEVPETTSTLVFNIFEDDSYDIISWAGNAIMTETNIRVYFTSKAVFDFLLEQGRYDFLAQAQGDSLMLTNKDMVRRIIKAEETETVEKVHSRIFIPDAFQEVAPGVWRRELEEEEEKGREQLEREKINVSEKLKEAVKPATDSTGRKENG